MRWALVLVAVVACKSTTREETSVPATPRIADAAIADAAIADAAIADAAIADAVVDAALVDAVPIDAPPATKKKPRTKSRAACLEECNKRNRYTDCADAEGGMMPCPCHCD
ncbi:MAG: hypothetical protein AB7T06_00705 [Kofleriaceae bacterium]